MGGPPMSSCEDTKFNPATVALELNTWAGPPCHNNSAALVYNDSVARFCPT
jgi:hypothetical protein